MNIGHDGFSLPLLKTIPNLLSSSSSSVSSGTSRRRSIHRVDSFNSTDLNRWIQDVALSQTKHSSSKWNAWICFYLAPVRVKWGDEGVESTAFDSRMRPDRHSFDWLSQMMDASSLLSSEVRMRGIGRYQWMRRKVFIRKKTAHYERRDEEKKTVIDCSSHIRSSRGVISLGHGLAPIDGIIG